MKTLIKITLVMIIISFSNICYGEFREYIDGINGIKWGTNINDINLKLHKVYKLDSFADYTDSDGNRYGFRDNKLEIYNTCKTSEPVELKQRLTDIIGKPTKTNIDNEDEWKKNNLTIKIKSLDITGNIKYYIQAFVENKLDDDKVKQSDSNFREYVDGINGYKWLTDIKDMINLKESDNSEYGNKMDNNGIYYTFKDNKFISYIIYKKDNRYNETVNYMTNILGKPVFSNQKMDYNSWENDNYIYKICKSIDLYSIYGRYNENIQSTTIQQVKQNKKIEDNQKISLSTIDLQREYIDGINGIKFGTDRKDIKGLKDSDNNDFGDKIDNNGIYYTFKNRKLIKYVVKRNDGKLTEIKKNITDILGNPQYSNEQNYLHIYWSSKDGLYNYIIKKYNDNNYVIEGKYWGRDNIELIKYDNIKNNFQYKDSFLCKLYKLIGLTYFREYIDGIDGFRFGEKIDPIEKGYKKDNNNKMITTNIYVKNNIELITDNNNIFNSYLIKKENIIDDFVNIFGNPEVDKKSENNYRYEWVFNNGTSLMVSNNGDLIHGSKLYIDFENLKLNKPNENNQFREYIDGINGIKWLTNKDDIDILKGKHSEGIIDLFKDTDYQCELYEVNYISYYFYDNKLYGYSILERYYKPEKIINYINSFNFQKTVGNNNINWKIDDKISIKYNEIDVINQLTGLYDVTKIDDNINKPSLKDIKGIILTKIDNNKMYYMKNIQMTKFNISNDYNIKYENEDYYCIEVDYEFTYYNINLKTQEKSNQGDLSRWSFVKRGKKWYGLPRWVK